MLRAHRPPHGGLRASTHASAVRVLLPLPALARGGPPPLPLALARWASAASSRAPKPPPAAPDLETLYQKKTPVEHVLLRPGMYIGGTAPIPMPGAWVLEEGGASSASSLRVARRDVTASPGLLKIFDEILVNACDNAARDPSMATLDVVIGPGGVGGGGSTSPPRITVTNDGACVPIALHRGEGIYIPELVFGHLLTGSNFADGDAGAAAAAAGGSKTSTSSASPSSAAPSGAATTGGRHGYGAKLTNIFSSEFIVQAFDASSSTLYTQVWRTNMSQRGGPVISSGKGVTAAGDAGASAAAVAAGARSPLPPLPPSLASLRRDFTRVSFIPDLTRFGGGSEGEGLSVDTLAVLRKRVLDAAGTVAAAAGGGGGSGGIAVSLNGVRLPVSSFLEYAKAYTPEGSGSGGGEGGEEETAASVTAPAAPPAAAAAGKRGAKKGAAGAAAVTAGGAPPPSSPATVPSSPLSHLAYARLNPRWELVAGVAGLSPSALSSSPEPASAFNEPGTVSFVNCMHTSRGGTHVAAVLDVLCGKIAAAMTKRVAAAAAAASAAGDEAGAALAGASVTPSLVRAHLRLFLNARIEAPAFDSQAKEQLVSPPSALFTGLVPPGTSLEAALPIPDRFIRTLLDTCGLADLLLDALRSKARDELVRTLRRSTRSSENKIKAIPKLEDANWAGSKRGHECTLIVTEGDSAKALAVAGLSVVGRDRYGVFPLRGKLLNVRDLPLSAALENAEVSALVTILGLDFSKSYAGVPPEKRGLRYGRVMVMADQDVDGSHIKGLLINLFHTYWPELVASAGPDASTSFLEAFVTPLIKAKRKGASGEVREFFSIREYEAWRASLPPSAAGGWGVKYYKGLGTSTSEEGRSYFRNLGLHRRGFGWGGASDGEKLVMAFAKDAVEARKAWLTAAAAGSEEVALAPSSPPSSPSSSPTPTTTTTTTIAEFVDRELIDFSCADLVRSIPSLLDGLKPSQRKVLYACFKRAGGGAGKGAMASGSSLPGTTAAVSSPDGDASAGSDSDSDTLTNPAPAPSSSPAPKLPPGGPEIKVAQLAGYVGETTAYHHGEASLVSTITGMAQNYLGSNNINLLEPLGQFGTRLQGGKDAASARYIFTRLAPAARLLFPAADDGLLRPRQDDGQPVEPVAYLPILPLLLLNGAAGIGTGWSTSVPPFDPHAVVDAVAAAVQNGGRVPPTAAAALVPWWRGFRGAVFPSGGGYTVTGCAEWVIPAAGSSSSGSSGKRSAKGKGGSVKTATGGSGSSGEAGGLASAGAWVAVTAADRAAAAAAAADAAAYDSDGEVEDDGAISKRGTSGSSKRAAKRTPSSSSSSSSPSSPTSGPGGATHVRISELPVGRWTDDYKAFLLSQVAKGLAFEVAEYHTEETAEFVVGLTPEGLAELARTPPLTLPPNLAPEPSQARETGSLLSFFKLSAAVSTRNMHAFDAHGAITRYDTPADVIAAFFPARAALYRVRLAVQAAELEAALARTRARARFLEDVISGSLVVAGVSKATLLNELWARGYVAVAPALLEPAEAAAAGAALVGGSSGAAAKVVDPAIAHLVRPDLLTPAPLYTRASSSSSSALPPALGKGGYDHLVSLPLWSLTAEAAARAKWQAEALEAALASTRATAPEALWLSELAHFRACLPALLGGGRNT